MTTLFTLALTSRAAVAADDPAQVAFFESRVRPVLVEHCYKCHSAGAKKLRGELRLDSRATAVAGGKTGPAIVPNKPDESLVVKSIRYTDPDLQMPPKERLSAQAVADLTRWVEMGAPWPDDGAAEGARVTTDLSKPEGRNHWAFQPVRRPPVPSIGNPQSATGNPIDAFILARLSDNNLAPDPPADRRTLVRRAYFDLLGLPPSPEDVEAFAADASPGAYAALVDRLLASPHYGERWGRHWLDLARYADTNGADENYAYNNAWRYRDYVVRSFNADKPYDQFVIEQLAGDLVPEEGALAEQIHDRLTATGFLVIGPKLLAEQDKAKLVMDLVDEQVDTVGQTFLGLTLGCARCHDHKFDPIPTADYYALAGIFKSTKTMANLGFVSEWNERELTDRATRARRERRKAELAAAKSAIERVYKGALPFPLRRAVARVTGISGAALAGSLEALPTVMAVADDKPQDVPIHLRGSHLTLAKASTPRGFVKVLDAAVKPPSIDKSHSGRLELARWITDPANPLTARVMVNRIWQGHFGTGLVSTSSNFGLRGQAPSHPELLDYLASKFVERGWSIKQMHRLIMLSATYQQDSALKIQDSLRIDPDNRLLSHQNRRRLEAEPIRDALIAAGGNLDATVGGSPGTLAKEKYVSLPEADPVFNSPRRAIYLPIVRSRMYDLFNIFDYVDAGVHTARRSVTTVPQQALFMLNSPLVARQAELLAKRLWSSDAKTDAARINLAYEMLYARPATQREVARALAHVNSQSADKLTAWTSLCRVLIAANEFVYVN